MDPGLFFGGILAGLLISQAWVSRSDSDPPCPPQPRDPLPPYGDPRGPHPRPGSPAPHLGLDPKIVQVHNDFLPFTTEAIEVVKTTDPGAVSSWRRITARLPYLTEAVAMYYAMEDPKVPMPPKLAIAGALVYLMSPADIIPDTIPVLGQADDLGVLLAALKYVYEHLDEAHLEQARAWLRSQGVDPKPLFAIGKDLTSTPTVPSTQTVLPFRGPRSSPRPQEPLQLPGPVAERPQTRSPFHDDQPPAPPPTWD